MSLTEGLFNSPIAGMALADRDLLCTQCNRRLAQIVGQPAADFVGRPLLDLFPGPHRSELEEALRAVCGGAKDHHHGAYDLQGERVATIHVELHASGIPSDGDTARRVLLQVVDVTAAQNSSERLRLTERALHAAGSGITIVDARLPDLPLVYVNPEFERITGYAAAEVMGKNCRFLNGLDPDQPGLEMVRNAIRNHQELTVTLRNFRKDQTPFWNELTISPVVSVQGELTHFVGIQDDVTHRMKEAAERERQLAEVMDDRRDAEDAASAREMMLAVVSHELRSPLNAIRLWTSLLQGADTPDPHTLKRAIDQIQSSVDTQSRLIADLLDATRFEAGNLQIDKRRFDWATAVRELTETEMPSAADRGVRLERSIPETPVWVYGDRSRLEQVLRNLLTNAFKFTPSGGSVSVSLVIANSRACLAVRDSGPGVEAEQLKRLFDRFWQADKRDERRHGGVGLGLYLVKQIVDQHAGSVSAHSDGSGMHFVVELPTHAGTDRARVGAPITKTEAAIGSELLVVDDDAPTAEALGLALRLRGHQVTVEHRVDNALQRIETARPRAMISDLTMPGRTGFDLMRTIRAQELDGGHPRLSALAISGRGGADDRRLVMAAGFDGYLEKPIDVSKLHTKLVALLSGSAETAFRVLIVGGERVQRESLRDEIVDAGHEVLVAATSAEALLLAEQEPEVLVIVGDIEDGTPSALAGKMRADSVSLLTIWINPHEPDTEVGPFDLVLADRPALLRQLAMMRPQLSG